MGPSATAFVALRMVTSGHHVPSCPSRACCLTAEWVICFHRLPMMSPRVDAAGAAASLPGSLLHDRRRPQVRRTPATPRIAVSASRCCLMVRRSNTNCAPGGPTVVLGRPRGLDVRRDHTNTGVAPTSCRRRAGSPVAPRNANARPERASWARPHRARVTRRSPGRSRRRDGPQRFGILRTQASCTAVRVATSISPASTTTTSPATKVMLATHALSYRGGAGVSRRDTGCTPRKGGRDRGPEQRRELNERLNLNVHPGAEKSIGDVGD